VKTVDNTDPKGGINWNLITEKHIKWGTYPKEKNILKQEEIKRTL
jgi:hypothetical protein